MVMIVRQGSTRAPHSSSHRKETVHLHVGDEGTSQKPSVILSEEEIICQVPLLEAAQHMPLFEGTFSIFSPFSFSPKLERQRVGHARRSAVYWIGIPQWFLAIDGLKQ